MTIPPLAIFFAPPLPLTAAPAEAGGADFRAIFSEEQSEEEEDGEAPPAALPVAPPPPAVLPHVVAEWGGLEHRATLCGAAAGAGDSPTSAATDQRPGPRVTGEAAPPEIAFTVRLMPEQALPPAREPVAPAPPLPGAQETAQAALPPTREPVAPAPQPEQQMVAQALPPAREPAPPVPGAQEIGQTPLPPAREPVAPAMQPKQQMAAQPLPPATAMVTKPADPGGGLKPAPQEQERVEQSNPVVFETARTQIETPDAPKPPRPAAQTAAVEPLATEPARPAAPVVREVSLTLPAAKVEVKVAGRDGEVTVAVRTPDPQLRTVLRSDLGALVERLERSGYRAEVSRVELRTAEPVRAEAPAGPMRLDTIRLAEAVQADPAPTDAARPQPDPGVIRPAEAMRAEPAPPEVARPEPARTEAAPPDAIRREAVRAETHRAGAAEPMSAQRVEAPAASREPGASFEEGRRERREPPPRPQPPPPRNKPDMRSLLDDLIR